MSRTKKKIRRRARKHVYLIHCENSNYYKIGVAINIQKRLASLQTGCPYLLQLVYSQLFTHKNAYFVEKVLHNRFYKNARWGEWFDLSKNELEKAIYFICATPLSKK